MERVSPAKQADLLRKMKDATRNYDLANQAVHDARIKQRNAREAYIRGISDDLIERLRQLEWEWPKQSGRRLVSARLPSQSVIVKMLRSIPEHYRIQLLPGVTIDYSPSVWSGRTCDVHEITTSPQAAIALKLPRPKGKRRDWSRLKRQLEKAGVTDEAELAELLKKRGE